MSVAESVASSVAESVASSVISSEEEDLSTQLYNTDAINYFSRAEALGGTFYPHAKRAVSTFVEGCKADSTWSLMTEAYLLCAVSWGGLLAKLKYDSEAVLTNNGFVEGDYAALGLSLGLTGDNSSYLSTGFNPAAATGSIGAYVGNRQDGYFIGASTAAFADRCVIHQTAGEVRGFWLNNTVYAASTPAATSGVWITTRRANNDLEIYENGSSEATNTGVVSGTVPTVPFILFGLNGNGTPGNFTTARLGFAFVGSAMTDTQALALSTRIQTMIDTLAG